MTNGSKDILFVPLNSPIPAGLCGPMRRSNGASFSHSCR